MATRNRITIRQSQRLSLNGRLLASIRVLGSDSIGLARFLEEAAAETPALRLDPAPQGEWLPRWRDAFARGGNAEALDQIASAEPGLIAHVLDGINALQLDPSAQRLALHLVEALEPTGWLGRPLEVIASDARVPLAVVEAVLTRLQQLEPRGLFARNLAECLRLQAAEEGWLDTVAEGVLARLPLVAVGDLARLAAQIGTDEPAVRQVIRRLRQLDPKPGARFAPCAAPVREPDLMVRPAAKGWEVALNRSSLPALRVDDQAEGWREAKAILRLIEGRNATLLRVATEILTRQAAALDHGPGALQPMTMAEVAQALGLSQGTVSRVVAGASVDTPRGTWWLRALFSQSIRGQGPSAASLREALGRLVAAEDPARPLTDDALSRALAGAGAPVARRTVAKYREMLGIPPAHRRRKRDFGRRGRG
jgi:RNA polymerase sigma-54 factor